MNIINTATTIITNTVDSLRTLSGSSFFRSAAEAENTVKEENTAAENTTEEKNTTDENEPIEVEHGHTEDDHTDEDTDDEEDSFNMSAFLERHPKKLKNIFPDDKCPVCLEKFNADEIIRTLLDCGHFVCVECMNKTIIPAGSSRHKCPLCREKGGFFDGDKYICRATTINRSHSIGGFGGLGGFDLDMSSLPEIPVMPEMPDISLLVCPCMRPHTAIIPSVENRIVEMGELDSTDSLTVFTDTEILIEELNHNLHLSTRNMDFFNIEDFLEELYPDNISFIRKLQNTMSIVFCLDATGSMRPFIDACKDNISNMVKEFLEQNPDFIMKVYINVFYDFDQEIVHKVFKCTATLENTTRIDTFLSNIHPKGGGDEAEDINTSLHIATGGIQTETTIGPQSAINVRGNSLLVISTDAYHKGFFQHMTEEEKITYSGVSDDFKTGHPHGLHFVDLLQKIDTMYKKVVVFKLNKNKNHCHMLELIHKYIPSSKEIDIMNTGQQSSEFDSAEYRTGGIVFRSASIVEGRDISRDFSDGVGTVLRSITRTASSTY